MPKEKPHDTSNVANNSNNGSIPQKYIGRFQQEIQGVDFGGVSLIVTIRDGHPTYRIEKTISIR